MVIVIKEKELLLNENMEMLKLRKVRWLQTKNLAWLASKRKGEGLGCVPFSFWRVQILKFLFSSTYADYIRIGILSSLFFRGCHSSIRGMLSTGGGKWGTSGHFQSHKEMQSQFTALGSHQVFSLNTLQCCEGNWIWVRGLATITSLESGRGNMFSRQTHSPIFFVLFNKPKEVRIICGLNPQKLSRATLQII